MLPTLSLCPLVLNRNVESEFLVKEKKQANALKTVTSTGKKCWKFYSKKEKNRILGKNQV